MRWMVIIRYPAKELLRMIFLLISKASHSDLWQMFAVISNNAPNRIEQNSSLSLAKELLDNLSLINEQGRRRSIRELRLSPCSDIDYDRATLYSASLWISKRMRAG